MQSEYFCGKVENIFDETEEVRIPEIKRLNFFRKEISYKIEIRTKHYAICSLIGADFLMKIPIAEEYGYLKPGDSVHIHLKFEYEYACFHYDKPKEKPKIIEAKERQYEKL